MRAAIGIGSNLGDARANVLKGFEALARTGTVVARSRLYRTKPWGHTDQPDFCNAVALIETGLGPQTLLEELARLERDLGRLPGERWGPRTIDFDILTYGDERIEMPGLQIPHARLYERAFALAPLAEVDPRFEPALRRLPSAERAAVVPLDRSETVALMPEHRQQASELNGSLVERVRLLAEAFLETDLVRLRIEEENEDAIEFRRALPSAHPAGGGTAEGDSALPAAPMHVDSIKADLVGIVHLSRPPVREGEMLDGDRELAHVEALGIRNPVRSLGAGRIVGVRCSDGQPVEYGQVLFEIDRG